MSSMHECSKQANILIVDDIPENLQVLAGMLKEQGYMVRPAPSGKMALAAAQSQPPDLILLDITMPEMDGYEVCKRLKEDSQLKDIPVIFISALTETLDKVTAFKVGGVDYVTKPFQFEEVAARVRTHLELRRSRLEVQTLLSKTLVASLRTMTDILAMINPVVFDQSNRLKRYAGLIGEYLEIDRTKAWHLEMAAMLSQIGCVVLPEEILDKKRKGVTLTVAEEKRFWEHTVVASELIGGIPRMETIAEIIGHQQQAYSGEPLTEVQSIGIVELGSKILRMLTEYDYLIMSGKNPVGALMSLQESIKNHMPVLLKALRFVVEQEAKETVRAVPISELSIGMVLMENIVTESELLLLHKSNELSQNLLSLLKQYAMQHKIREPIKVLTKSR